ncbi:MAG: serine/threonine-protein kinase, partial [Verrucomicrobiota bacterium]
MDAIAETQLQRKTESGGSGMSDDDATEVMKTLRSKNPAGFELPEPEELQELFPELEISELLGAGGMGAVYQARQPKLKRDVAVKILSKKLAADPEFVARFQREAQAMASLSHPNIVTIYDFGDRGGYYYFVMEFIDGGDLQQLLAADKLSPVAVLELIPQICGAIQFAHEEGITHRDIKPANILLDTKGRVKIADFGLAKILAGTTDISLTMPGTAMGTPFYMAPEQLTDAENVDERADIYSLGVVLYQMLTGVLPQGDFDPPSKTLPELGSSVDNAVMRALAQDPDLRFSEVREMMEALEVVRAQRQKRAAKSGGGGSRLALPWVVAAALAAIVAVGASVWKPWADDEESNMGIPARGGAGEETTGRNAHPTIELPPALAAMKERGGRLRGWTNADEPLDLSRVKDVEDFLRLFSANIALGQLHLVRSFGPLCLADCQMACHLASCS